MIGDFKDIPRVQDLDFLDPGGHLVEVQVKVNGKLLYGRSLVFEGVKGNGSVYEYRTDQGKKVTRARNASIQSLAKDLL